MQVTQKPHLKADPPTKSDWFATLKTEDGIHILVQIGYQATEEQARKIVEAFEAAHP